MNLRHPLHAAQEDEQLEDPHEEETEPGQRRKAENIVVASATRPRRKRKNEHLHGFRREVSLHAIPDDADDAADDGGQIRTHDAEGNAAMTG